MLVCLFVSIQYVRPFDELTHGDLHCPMTAASSQPFESSEMDGWMDTGNFLMLPVDVGMTPLHITS